jgi:hypothetical protein
MTLLRPALRKINRTALAAAVFCAALALVTTQAQADGASSPVTAATSITIRGEDGKAKFFDFAALDKLPQQKVHAEAHGNAIDCTGPNLIDVLTQTGVASGEALRGKNLSLYARATAADGYHVVFALAELDPGFRDSVPILTHRCNGRPLDAKEGPFRIIVPGEKRPARWIRQVTSIDVLRAP